MNKKRMSVVFAACAFVLLLGVTMLTPISADVGNTFGGGSSSSGSSGSSSGGFGGFIFLLGSPTGIIVLLVVLGILFFARKNNSNSNGGSTYANPGVSPNLGFNEDEVIARIKQEDPTFSAENFKAFSSEVWLSLQEAWEKKSWQIVRPFESNTLFNVHNRQLQEYIDHKKTNFMEMQNVRNVSIARYRLDEEFEILCVKLDASLLDYVVDDTTQEVIEGSKTEYVHRSYNLEFIRKKGVKTETKEGTNVTNCPNCGAPTNVTSSGQCEFCKSVITKGDFGWVLNKYAAWQ